MYMYTTTITQDGMVQLTEDIMEALGLKIGDKVTIDYSGDVIRVMPCVK